MVKGQVRTTVDMLMDIFNNVGKKDENEVDNQRANRSAATEARSKIQDPSQKRPQNKAFG